MLVECNLLRRDVCTIWNFAYGDRLDVINFRIKYTIKEINLLFG
jgi:hypothetical protein